MILGIQKQPGANTLELTRTLDATLDDIQKTLPKGMSIDRHIFRQADFIERALHNLLAALRDGALLVVIVVLVFLMNMRAAAITLVALPLSLVAAVLSMNYFGFTINSMSLGGLAIAIGELVDDAIIDVENVCGGCARMRRSRKRSDNPPSMSCITRVPRFAARLCLRRLIVVLVFLPLFFLGSVEGRLLRPLGFAYVVSLIASLVTALTVTPAMCSLLLPKAKTILSGKEPWLVRQIKRHVPPRLAMVDRPSEICSDLRGASVGRRVGSYFLMGRAFLPEFNEGTLTISAVTIPGTSLAESDQLGSALERILHTVPEVVSTARRTGRAELDEHVQGVESAELDVDLR